MLVPEYIEKFFLKASEKRGIKVEKRKDGVGGVPSVPYEFKIRFGQVFREYNKFTFDKEEAFRAQAEFVAPGHPLLEAFVEKIFEKYARDVEKGAVFLDPSASMNGFIWFLEGQVNDGTGSAAGKRIFALYQDGRNNIRLVSPSILWDLKPEKNVTSETSQSSAPDVNSMLAFAIEKVLPSYLEELKKQRIHDAEIKKKYGVRSLQELILESERKLIEYETRRAKGENVPDIVIQNEKRNREELERKKAQLEKQIESEVNLLPAVPKIIGVVQVLPKLPTDDTLKEDREIEDIGMKMAMSFEVAQGRSPEDVSEQNLGFDIRSKAPDGSFRYIEVKARAREGKIALTPNEWLMAHRLRDEYWLYVITNAGTTPELYTIQNPAGKLKPAEEVEVVRYIVENWKSVAIQEEIGDNQ